MREFVLELSVPYAEVPIAKLIWRDGVVTHLSAEGTLQAELRDVVEKGLHEWVGPLDDRMPRTTNATDPEFLPRLAAFLRSQSGLFITLRERDQPPHVVVIDITRRGLDLRTSIGPHGAGAVRQAGRVVAGASTKTIRS
jgi:hypothetical protein